MESQEGRALFKIENNEIEIYEKTNYGTTHIYIKRKEIADAISRLTGRKTIDKWDIKTLISLGFNFKIVAKTDVLDLNS